MDINHVDLNNLSLASLYKGHLVESISANPTQEQASLLREVIQPAMPEPVDSAEIAAPLSFKSLGSNQQRILILVSEPGVVFLPDPSLKFLTGILTACKLSLADVAIVNLHQYVNPGYKEIVPFFHAQKVLLFGAAPEDIRLPLNFPAFQPQAFNGCTYLWAPELKNMENDRALKTQLWNSLKQLFNI
ncbi:MAG: hypothetical protein J0M10_12355 [Chitinophagales bacterium]|nr:hypothetical protein [Chitinophagales bacterium]